MGLASPDGAARDGGWMHGTAESYEEFAAAGAPPGWAPVVWAENGLSSFALKTEKTDRHSHRTYRGGGWECR